MSLVCQKHYGAVRLIDANGDNLFEQNKVTFNERKEEAKKAIYPNVKFIK